MTVEFKIPFFLCDWPFYVGFIIGLLVGITVLVVFLGKMKIR